MPLNSTLNQQIQQNIQDWQVLQTKLQRDSLIIKNKLSVSQYKLAKELTNQKLLEHVGRGVFIDPKWTPNDFLLRQLVLKQGIYFGDTALYLWHLTDTFPYNIYMAFQMGYTLPRQPLEWVHNVTAKQLSKNQLNIAIEELTVPSTTYKIKVYSRERTLIDLVRNPSSYDPETVTQAFARYTRSSSRQLTKLSLLAEQFGVTEKIQQRIEGLII